MDERRIYLDHNSTTPVHPEVLKAMLPYFSELYGNASSIHRFGQQARKAVEESREKIAQFIGARPEEIFFTGGGTESDNLAVKGIALKAEKGSHIITSSVEHPAVLNPCRYLEKQGYKVTYLGVDKYGIIDPEAVKKAVTAKTVLITVMQANNETGALEPIAGIGAMAREKGIAFHTDAVQSAGKIPINVKELNTDMLSISGHKLYGPKGIGALYIRKGTKVQSLIQGGHHERNLRAGTENVPGIAGLAKAVEIAAGMMGTESPRLAALRDRLCGGLMKRIDRVFLNGHPENRLPSTVNMSFEYVEGESIILNLDLKGVAVSSGSACTSGSLEPSHVLKAMGVDPALSQGSIRFSLGKDNTEADIDYVLEIMPEIITRLRKMSPLYKPSKNS